MRCRRRRIKGWTNFRAHDLLAAGRFPIVKKRFLLVAACALATQPASAGTREDVLAAMQRCAVFQDDKTWLECTYGAQQLMRARLGLPPAPDYQQRLVPPAPTVSSLPAPAISSAAAPAPAGRTAVPAAAPRRSGFFDILSGTASPVAVSAVAAIRYDTQGAFIITLQNGQIWRQLDAETAPKAGLRVGSRVTIIPGALWSYNLRSDDNPHAFKVARRS